MSEKQAPPAYSEAAGPQGGGGFNTGYAPPPGDQGGQAGGYGQQAGGYAQQAGYPPQGGYPQGYGAGYGQYPQGYNPGQYQYQQQTVVMTQPGQQGMVVNSVPDNMGLAIFTTICCCWPLGIVAIMRAQESRSALTRGDVTAASRYSQESRRFSMFAIAGGIVSIIVAIIIIVVVVVSNVNRYRSIYDD